MHLLIRISIFTFLIIQIHSCCLTVSCDLVEPTLNLRLMRDGKNAVYGPDAFISDDSIHLYLLDSLRPYTGFYKFEREEILQFTVYEGEQYFLEIPGILADTFAVQTGVVVNGGCCKGIFLAEVRRNGEIFCEGECGVVLEIEI